MLVIEKLFCFDRFRLVIKGIVKRAAEADARLVKLVVMTNVFLNYHQHEIEIKRLICAK